MTKVKKYALLVELLHIPNASHLIQLFLSRLNPEAEIGFIDGGCLYSKFEDGHEDEIWAWRPETGWYEVPTDDDLIHPWECSALNGVDSLSTLGGIDG